MPQRDNIRLHEGPIYGTSSEQATLDFDGGAALAEHCRKLLAYAEAEPDYHPGELDGLSDALAYFNMAVLADDNGTTIHYRVLPPRRYVRVP